MSTEAKCPQCGGPTVLGYGFAGGGGIGAWVACLDCDFISKEVSEPGQCLHDLPPAGPVEEETE